VSQSLILTRAETHSTPPVALSSLLCPNAEGETLRRFGANPALTAGAIHLSSHVIEKVVAELTVPAYGAQIVQSVGDRGCQLCPDEHIFLALSLSLTIFARV